MFMKKLKKIHPAVWLSFGLITGILLLFYFLFIRVYDWALAEDRDYALMDELHSVGSHAEAYKKMNGAYPKSLADINKSDKFCVNSFYIKKCTTIYYKPTADLQDFKMAADTYPMSGAWPILFYSPEYSVTQQVLSNINSEEYQAKYKNVDVCVFCAAYKSAAAKGLETSYPVYKKDPKYFSKPEEWPDIP
jgi:hypothetical protein